MKSLEELLDMDGVVVACEFSNEGNCINYKSKMELSPELANRATEYVATVSMLFDTLASGFTKESPMNWLPQKCWTYTGGEWTAVVGGNRAVFVDIAKANLNELFAALAGERKTDKIKQCI